MIVVDSPTALVGHNLAVRFDRAESAALDNIDLSIARGELVAIVGENGCGKSTLCLVLAGVIAPDQGVVLLDGRPLNSPAPLAIQLLQQSVEDQVVAPVVYDDTAFGVECLGLSDAVIAERVDESLCRAGLAGFGQRQVETLSGGELARLALAGALAIHPDYLLADEPTAQLDPPSAERFVLLLRELADSGSGVLFVSHRLEETRHADRLIVLRAGRVVATGAPRTILYDEALLHACGLDSPPIVRLVRAWRDEGRTVEGAPLTAAELAEAVA